MTSGKRNKSYGSRSRVHTSREDRALTRGGKTKYSKVRSQGRTARALARAKKTKEIYSAKR